MEIKELVKTWFEIWEKGNFLDLPLSENFVHTSPYGTINGKQDYINLVEGNKDMFLGYQFKIHDQMYENGKACIQYTAMQGDFTLDVSEWHYAKGDTIDKIIAYYNIEGEISEERKLSNPEGYN